MNNQSQSSANGNATSTPNTEKEKFVLFPNKNKKEDKHPDFQGNVEVTQPDGKVDKYKVVAWKKTSKTGLEYLSGIIDYSKVLEDKPQA